MLSHAWVMHADTSLIQADRRQDIDMYDCTWNFIRGEWFEFASSRICGINSPSTGQGIGKISSVKFRLIKNMKYFRVSGTHPQEHHVIHC